jgi:hypothetical protein
MVKQAAKPLPTIIPTWWNRGPSGQVEEWETRVSEEEIIRRQDRSRPSPSQKAQPRKASTPRH